MNIGIFDTGNGGLFVKKLLQKAFLDHKFIRVADPANAPYGSRSNTEIVQLSDIAIQPLLANCQIIVIACNTVTAVAIDKLREKYPNTRFVGYEPMMKPATQNSQSKHLTVLATVATLRNSQVFKQLSTSDNYQVDYTDTTNWARLIDQDDVDSIDLAEVEASYRAGSDSILIGCTHYIALIDRLTHLMPNATIYEPTPAIINVIRRQVDELQQ